MVLTSRVFVCVRGRWLGFTLRPAAHSRPGLSKLLNYVCVEFLSVPGQTWKPPAMLVTHLLLGEGSLLPAKAKGKALCEAFQT